MNGTYPIAGVMESVDCEPPGDIQVMLPYWIYRRICDLLVAVQPGKGWAFAREQPRNSAGVAQNALTKIRVIHERLETVEIDHTDFRRCIENRDASTTFLFPDPPYLDMSQYRVGDFGVREPREPLYTAASQTPLMDLFGLGTG
jgi:hypothetical protein